MAIGAKSKKEIAEKLITLLSENGYEVFLYNDGKEVRINCVEDGNPVQIKCALTYAKNAVSAGEDNAVPQATSMSFSMSPSTPDLAKPTDEERRSVTEALKRLGF